MGCQDFAAAVETDGYPLATNSHAITKATAGFAVTKL
jgi:hypothetical protein